MLLPIPFILMLSTALTLFILRLLRPKYQYAWLIASGGALLSLGSVLLWQIRLPQTFSLFAWQPQSVFAQTPFWLVDRFSWPLAISISTFSVAVIMTAIASNDLDARSWIRSLVLCATGLAVVTAGNPLTLVLVWTFLDLVELVIMLRSSGGEKQSEAVVSAFAARLCATGLVLWASMAFGPWTDFRFTPVGSGIYLFLATALRLGVIPLYLPYKQENMLQRGFGTTLHLVAAASALTLLVRLPNDIIGSPLTPYLFILIALTAIYAAWKWLRASDELTGRPFWVLGMASLAIAAALRANPTGSLAWSSSLLLSGGMLFLYSTRQRGLLWLPLLGLLGISTLPFSLTASGWQSGSYILPVFWIIFLPVLALLIAGYVRHALHPGESSFESQPRLIQTIYILGLLIPLLILLLLGLWGWEGAALIGTWWVSIVVVVLAVISIILALTVLPRLDLGSTATNRMSGFFRKNWINTVVWGIYRFLGRISRRVTDTLEGDGGVLWSFLLLVLFLSIFSSLR